MASFIAGHLSFHLQIFAESSLSPSCLLTILPSTITTSFVSLHSRASHAWCNHSQV
jgi:hypothetical protein